MVGAGWINQGALWLDSRVGTYLTFALTQDLVLPPSPEVRRRKEED